MMLGVSVHLPSSGVPSASSCGRYRRILTRSSDDAKSAGKAATSDRSFESSSVHIQRAKQRGCVSRKDSTVAACLAPNGRPVEFQKTCTALRLLSGQHCAVMVTCVRMQMNIHACMHAGTRARKHTQARTHSIVPWLQRGASPAEQTAGSLHHSHTQLHQCCEKGGRQ